jgi:hypothetical protein
MQKYVPAGLIMKKKTVVVSGQGSPSLLMAFVVVDLTFVGVVHHFFLQKIE